MIEFKPAKNNEITATYNGLWLHSSYNPSKEAERFAESLQPAKSDRFIIIIEPALSYCASFIKKRFPDKKTGAIRLVKDFSDYNGNFDFIIDLSNEKKESFSEIIFNTLGEEKIYSTYFADWEPSRKSFTEMHEECINAIKTCMEKSKTLLVTREYFEKKWFLNTLNFIKYTKNTVKLCKKIDRDILIIASGPSLHENLNTIKTYRRNFFIIVLSSAISVCSKNNIIPDLCMSTDGGFWAGEHLKRMPEKSVLALSSESFCSRRILEKCNILPMQYEDGLSRSILERADLKELLKIKRNGTVSGTALDFALDYGEKNIYFFGLDMAASKGFQHEQPNELEINNSINDFKLNSLEKRSFKSEKSSASLNIYLQWFQNKKINNRKVFRVIAKAQNSLGDIKDIPPDNFSDYCKNMNSEREKSQYFENNDFKVNMNKLSESSNQIFSDKNMRQLFPLTSLSLEHNPDNEELKSRLNNERAELKKKLEELNRD